MQDENPKAAPASAFAKVGGRPIPPALEHALGTMDPEEWKKIEIVIANTPLTKELMLVTRFLDEILRELGNATLWVGANRVTGPELEVSYERCNRNMKDLVVLGTELARRMNRTETLQRNKKILSHYGLAVVQAPREIPRPRVVRPVVPPRGEPALPAAPQTATA